MVNGGYTASCMLAAASAHLSSRGQPDTLTAHFEYPNRTAVGPAVVTIEDVKLAGQLSTLQLTLWQGGLLPRAPWVTASVSRRTVLAYATCTNLRTFTGLSLPTGYSATAAAALPAPLPDFGALEAAGDADDGAWEESKLLPSAMHMHSLRNWRFYLRRAGPLAPGVLDMWICLASGEPITQGALAYVIDSFPYNMHTSLVTPELRKLLEAPQDRGKSQRKGQGQQNIGQANQNANVWLPTVVMNLEVKTKLPEEGVRWLAVRVTSKQIKDGRFDLEVLVRDVEGELVVLSHHVAMIVSMEKNTRKSPSNKAAL